MFTCGTPQPAFGTLSRWERDLLTAGKETTMTRIKIAMACALVALSTLAASAVQAPGSQVSAPIEYVKIAPGEFMMGCLDDDPQCDDEEKPAHRVRITKAFELGKYEVTQAQWQAVMNTNPS